MAKDIEVSKLSMFDESFSNLLRSDASNLLVNNVFDNIVTYEELISDPHNLDFSNFPYSDGSRESMMAIARYVRDLTQHVPNPVKYNYILDFLSLSPYELNVILAVMNHESKPGNNRYEESFAGITSVINRGDSLVKCGYVKNWLKIKDRDYVTLYDHITAPNQYQPYGNNVYLYSMDNTEGEAYQACLDALFVMDVIPQRMHNYMDFIANGLQHKRPGSFQIVKGGNWYSNVLTEDNSIPFEERYYNIDKTIEDEKVLSLR